MIDFWFKLFFVSFFINLLYEMIHSLLYKTCLEAPLSKYIYLMLKGAIFDGISIVIMYSISHFSFSTEPSLTFYYKNIFIFLVVSLLFAYLWEYYSIKNKRWEYSNKMPIVLGVGLTPLIQLSLTGILSLYLIFHFC